MEGPRAHALHNPRDHTALAGSIPTLEDDDDTFWEFQDEAEFADAAAMVDNDELGIFTVADFDALESVYVSTNSQGLNAAGTADDPLPLISAGVGLHDKYRSC